MQGFDYGIIFMQQERRRRALVLTDLDAVVSRKGRVYPGALLYRISTERDVPLYTSSRIANQESITSFDLRRVKQVQITGKSYVREAFLAGAIVDALVIAVMLYYIPQSLDY